MDFCLNEGQEFSSWTRGPYRRQWQRTKLRRAVDFWGPSQCGVASAHMLCGDRPGDKAGRGAGPVMEAVGSLPWHGLTAPRRGCGGRGEV